MWLRSSVLFRPGLVVVCRRFVLDPATLMQASSAPLLSNIMPHLQTLVNFETNTLPKPVLVELVYRLTILLGAARALPYIGVYPLQAAYGLDNSCDVRAVGSALLEFMLSLLALDI